MLGELIRNARRGKSLSQSGLAELTGISPTQIGLVERNKSVPSPRSMILIAEYLSLGAVWVSPWMEVETRLGTQLRAADLAISRKQWATARQILQYAWRMNTTKYGGRYRHRLYHLAGKLAYGQQRYATAYRWFKNLGSHLPHANAGTRGLAAYNEGLSLLKLGRLTEAYEACARARRLFASDRKLSLWEGYAIWAMANCLFEQHFYPQALPLYQIALRRPLRPEDRQAVQLGDLLCNWIVSPNVITATRLMAFGAEIVAPDLKERWRLVMGIYFHQNQRIAEALSMLEQIPRDTVQHDIYVESLAERALCHWALGSVPQVTECLRQFEEMQYEGSDYVRLFMWLLRRLIESSPTSMSYQVLKLNEGYDKRVQRITSMAVSINRDQRSGFLGEP
jgi:transcriptional regulator with XRE-family HTH domain